MTLLQVILYKYMYKQWDDYFSYILCIFPTIEIQTGWSYVWLFVKDSDTYFISSPLKIKKIT